MVFAIALILRHRPKSGMWLKLGTRTQRPAGQIRGSDSRVPDIGFTRIRPTGERPLNVVFNYNGHSWDAYEVLGLPAGSSLEMVQQAYREALATADQNSLPLDRKSVV